MLACMERLVRRPFGMPSWLFWVLVVVVASLPGIVPYVGPVIFLGLIIWAIVWWAKLPRVLPPGVVPITRFEKVQLSRRQEVVGESHYQDAIGGFVARNGRSVAVALVHEPKNKHSPSRSAVRIDLFNGDDVVTCGYLPEKVSPTWVPTLTQAASNGVRLWCDAEVRGGYIDAPNYGVWLTPEKQRKKPRFEAAQENDGAREFWANQPPNA